MDKFFEKLVKKNKTTFDIMLAALIIFGAVLLILILFVLSGFIRPATTLILVAQLGVAYGAYILVGRRNVEYEYCVTEGDIDVDIIYNRSKRKKLVAVPAKSITVMAPLGDSRLPQYDSKSVIDATSGNENVNVYIVIFENQGRKILAFEPTDAMVEQIKLRNPRNVY